MFHLTYMTYFVYLFTYRKTGKCIQPLAIVSSAAIHMVYKQSFIASLLLLLSTYLEMEFLDHVVTIFYFFDETLLFSTVVAILYFYQQCCSVSISPHCW
jgi:hypothetical protein